MTAISSKMMEFEGKTLEDAIRSACNYFGTEESSLDIQVLSKASSGIFGLGGKKYRILATLKANADDREKQEKNLKETKTEMKDETSDKKNKEDMVKEEHTTVSLEIQPTDDTFKEGESLTFEEIDTPDSELDALESSEEDEDDEEAFVSEVSEEEFRDYLNQMKSFLDKMFELAKLDVTTSIKHDEKGEFIDISGNDIHLVIGRDGTNLDAIYYIINRVLQNKTNKNVVIRVDADGYNRRHEMRLIETAERLAKRAKQTGRSMVLSPLSPRDRRLVHMHLKLIGGVRTNSVGDGVYKKIIIIPNRQRFRDNRRHYNNRDSFGYKRHSYGRDHRDRRDMRGNYQKPHRSSRYKKSH